MDSGRTCPVCLSKDLDEIIKIPSLPAHCNLLWMEEEEAINAPRGDLYLLFCNTCNHIHNSSFDQSLMEYSETYENALDFSPTFQSYAHDLAEYLVQRYDLHNKDVIDIGCGKGEFLKLLVRLGDNRGVGFDPSYEPLIDEDDYATQLTFIKEFYSQKHASYHADLICSRHVLEHIERPREFVSMVRSAIGERLQTAIYFEVPNALYTFRDLGIWDMIYEHPSFFSSSSLAHLFRISGFVSVRVMPRYEGQFLGLEAYPGEIGIQSPDIEPRLTEIGSCIDDFRQRYENKIEWWRNRLGDISSNTQKIVVWGAGSKGVTFLNLLHGEADIDYVVDINPRKQGKFIPGTGSAIIPPDELRSVQPDHVVIMNPIYEGEIREITDELGLSPEFWFA